MGEGGALGIGVGAESGQIGGDGGADILTQNDRSGSGEVDPALSGHGDGDGAGDGRGLHDNREHRAEGEEEQDRPEAVPGVALDERERLRITFDVGDSVFKKNQTEKKQTEADQELAGVAQHRFAGKDERHRDTDDREGDARQAELEAEQGDDPKGGRRAQVGAHDHADCFDDGEETGIDETDHHDRRGR